MQQKQVKQQQQLQIDSDLFKQNETKCNVTANESNNIIDECEYLKRLVFGLRYYNNIHKNNTKAWNEFCLNIYSHKLLDDYHHLLGKHQDNLEQIKQELIKKHGFTDCKVNDCQFSHRHFNENRRKNVNQETNDEENGNVIGFYEQEYDSLHFQLFHLFDVGYRFKVTQNKKKQNYDDAKTNDNDDKYTKCVDDEFSEMVKKINYDREKYKDTFKRFKNENTNNNKYNIDVKNDNAQHDDDDKTFTDKIFEYFQANGIKQNDLNRFYDYLCEEQYDSDAIKNDIDDDILYGSNIRNDTPANECVDLINKYIKYSQAMGNTFSTGLIFYYWPYFKVQDEKQSEIYYNINDYSGIRKDKLFIEKSKYSNMKEEALNSGYCILKIFNEKII
eukprot:448333_1